MNIILLMTLSGSILFLLFIIIDKLYKDLFSYKMKYIILKVSLILHLIPLNLVISLLKNFFTFINSKNAFSNIFINGNRPVTLISSNEHQYNTSFKINSLFLGIWITISIVIFIHYIRKFIKLRRYVFQIAHEVTSPNILNIIDKYQSKLKIKQKIRIFYVNNNITPFTFGILKPIVIIPKIEKSYELDLVLYHELYHIKNKDEFILFLRLLITGVYWFNPFIYLLNYKLKNNCELACDEFITKELSINKRKKYASLIIELAINNTDSYQNSITAFNNNSKLITERIEFIMNKKNSKTNMSILISTLIILCSIIPAFAYSPIQIFEYKVKDNIVINIPSSKDFITYSTLSTSEESNEIEITVYYNNQFTDIYGNTYNIDDLFNYKDCKHSFADGIFTKHNINLEGDCNINYYSAYRCVKCGFVIVNSLVQKTNYIICPH